MCKYKKTTSLVASFLSAVMLCDYANSADIAPFRITGVDGEVYAKYFTDEYKDEYEGVVTSRREGTTAEEGLDFTIRSYIYHPNFFRLDFGGGPVFVQQTYESYTVDNSNKEDYFNLHARANILEKKPYPLTLYYDRRSSTSPYAVQDRMLLTRENYGLNFKLKRPLSPAQVSFDLSHTQTDGENIQSITDESTDRASLKVSSDLGSNGDGDISYSWTSNNSGSGSKALDINPTTRVLQVLDARTEHLFGLDEWIRFTNRFIYRDQDNLPELTSLRYTPRLRLTHSRTLKSFYRYSYLNKTVEQIDTTDNQVNAGLNHTSFNDRLKTHAEVHGDKYDTEGLKQSYYRGDLNLSFLQPYNYFNIRYYGGWSADYTDRVGDDVSVIAERHALSSLNDFELHNRNVIQSSVVINNVAGTLTYREGIDYILEPIADVTRVQWINLNDPDYPLPDVVLVSYSYESGGTAEFTGFRQNYRIDLTRGNYLRLFAGYRSIDRELQSGNPTIPLNSEETMTTGLQVDYPLRNNWTLGGKAEHESHDADVGSYRRNSAGVYLEMPKVLKGKLRLFTDRLFVDNLESTQDVDLTRYGLRYNSRIWHRTNLTANLIDETDTGGSLERSSRRASVRLGWAYRQLNFSAEASYYTNKLGESQTQRSNINLLLSRKF